MGGSRREGKNGVRVLREGAPDAGSLPSLMTIKKYICTPKRAVLNVSFPCFRVGRGRVTEQRGEGGGEGRRALAGMMMGHRTP